MKNYLKLMRPKHYIKNFLIFIPMVFAKEINLNNIITILIAFISFSLMCSCIYIINDIKDIEKDKLHPEKKKRPLPSGKVSKRNAEILLVVLFIISIILNILSTKSLNYSLIFLMVYFIINLLYSLGLKNICILDIVLLASGFVLRVYYGAAIFDIKVSEWLFLTIMCASMFLGIGKRNKEYQLNSDCRKSLKNYNKEFLNQFQYLFVGLTIVFYSLWTINQTYKYLYLSIPFVIVIFMKYCLDVECNTEGDPVTVLYNDKVLIIVSLLYILLMGILLFI